MTLAWDSDRDQSRRNRQVRSHEVSKGRASQGLKVDHREDMRGSEGVESNLDKIHDRHRHANQKPRVKADNPHVRVPTTRGDFTALHTVVVGDEDLDEERVEAGARTDFFCGSATLDDSATDVPTTARSEDRVLEDSDAELASSRCCGNGGCVSGGTAGVGCTSTDGHWESAEVAGGEIDHEGTNSGNLEDLWEFVIQGQLDDKEQHGIAHKGVTCFPSSAMERIKACGVACVCERGHRLNTSVPNQDDFVVAMRTPVRQGHVALYGVFDGHGPAGHHCAAFARSCLPECVFGDPEIFARPKAVLRRAFCRAQHALLQQPFDIRASGTTATIALVIGAHRTPTVPVEHGDQAHRGDDVIFVAHVGDSRAILASRRDGEGCVGGAAVSFAVSQLTRDHRPDDPGEELRVMKAGGEIRKLNRTSGAPRVFVPGRSHPALALTRALGDVAATKCGVLSEPEVTSHRLPAGTDAVLVLGTDGLFEFFSNRDVVAPLLQCGISTHVLEEVAAESKQRWARNSYNQTVDDTTAIAVSLATHFG